MRFQVEYKDQDVTTNRVVIGAIRDKVQLKLLAASRLKVGPKRMAGFLRLKVEATPKIVCFILYSSKLVKTLPLSDISHRRWAFVTSD